MRFDGDGRALPLNAMSPNADIVGPSTNVDDPYASSNVDNHDVLHPPHRRATVRARSPSRCETSAVAERKDVPIDQTVAALAQERVVELLIAAADRHRDVEHEVRLAAARASGDLEPVKVAARQGLRSVRGFLGYRESNEWAAQARPVVTELTALAADAPSAELVDVIQKAIDRTVKAILRADDSGGQMGDVAHELLDAHARACDGRVVDPRKLARWIIKFDLGDAQDFFYADPVRYADALGERGLRAIREAVDTAAGGDTDVDAATGTDADAADGDVVAGAGTRRDRFAVRYLRERLAIVDRDVDAIVRLLGGDLAHGGRHLAVAEAMDEIDRPDLVLEWTSRGIDADGWQIDRLVDLACATHERLGAPLEALRLRRAHHERAASSSTYAKLQAAAETLDTWPVERDGARAALRDRDVRGYVHALLADGDDDEAWDAAVAAAEQIDDRTWLQLAERREASEPMHALRVYLEVADRTLIETGRPHYARAIRILRSARGMATTADLVLEFETYLVLLHEHHRRRPSLIEMLHKAGLVPREA